MSEMAAILGVLSGVTAGFLHATMLWLGSRHLSEWGGILGAMRMGVVGLILIVAAINGQIVVTASAWAISFAVFAVVFYFLGIGRIRGDRPADHVEQGKPPHAA